MNTESTKSTTTKEGFTLLQLLMVISIIAILFAVMFPITGAMRKRAEKVKCMSNMKTLALALNNYVSENRKWPQVPSKAMEKPETMWKWWMETFEVDPYNVPRKTWVCPTVLNKSGLTEDKKITLGSYATTNFDGSSPNRPYQWNQPWLVEIGNHHGSGQLYLMPDGSIRTF